MAQRRETKSALTVLKELPAAISQAKELFFTKHQVVSSPVPAEEERSAFDAPKGVDASTADGQRTLKHYRNAKARRTGYRAVPHVHIEPGALPKLLGQVTIEPISAVEATSKPQFLMNFTRRRVKAVDSMERNIKSGHRLIEETVELDHLFHHLDHRVSLEDHRKHVAEKHARKLEAIQGEPSVKWVDDASPTTATVVWEK